MDLNVTANITFYPQADIDHETALAIVYVTSAVLFTVGIPTNAMILHVIRKHRSLRKPTYSFIASLAVADLLVLILMCLFVINLMVMKWHSQEYRAIVAALDMFLGSACMCNVACISIDRAIAINHGLTYNSVVTSKRCRHAVCAMWVYSILILALSLARAPIDNELYDKIILNLAIALSYFVPAVTIVVCYTIIIGSVVKNLRFTQFWSEQKNRLNYDPPVHRHSRDSKGRPRAQRRAAFLHELKLTANILILVVPFFSGWTSLISLHVYEQVCGLVYNMSLNLVVMFIPWVLSGSNPVLYILLTRPIRKICIKEIRSVLPRMKRSSTKRRGRSRTSTIVGWFKTEVHHEEHTLDML